MGLIITLILWSKLDLIGYLPDKNLENFLIIFGC